ncbi:MAG TPA: alpha/beta hydrolase [Verrucomicrobiae bacterium]|nr:alpha/beta hydrolase [Verrucomicrobiae bacterium]
MNIDGVEVLVEGTGAETIVMIHGWPDTYRLWTGTVDALKDRCRCVRFSLPGFEPGHERRTRTLDELMGFISRVVDAVAPTGKVTLLLHDWGCVFGYNWYARNPQRVKRIVGVDIGDTVSFAASASFVTKLMVAAYQFTLAWAWKRGSPKGDEMVRSMARKMRCPSDYSVMNAGMTYPYYMTWFGKPSFRDGLQAFEPTVPFLYLYATRKPFMFHDAAWLERMRARAGNAVQTFDTGHWIMLAEPARFHQVVRDWLAAQG